MPRNAAKKAAGSPRLIHLPDLSVDPAIVLALEEGNHAVYSTRIVTSAGDLWTRATLDEVRRKLEGSNG